MAVPALPSANECLSPSHLHSSKIINETKTVQLNSRPLSWNHINNRTLHTLGLLWPPRGLKSLFRKKWSYKNLFWRCSLTSIGLYHGNQNCSVKLLKMERWREHWWYTIRRSIKKVRLHFPDGKWRLASAPSVNAGGKIARCGCTRESSPGGRCLQLQSFHPHLWFTFIRLKPLLESSHCQSRFNPGPLI